MTRNFTRMCTRSAARLVAWFVACLATSLAGCMTPQQRAAQAQAEASEMMTIYGPACSRLGYVEQSDAWRNCVIALSTKYDLQHYGPPAGYYGPGYWRDGWWGPYW